MVNVFALEKKFFNLHVSMFQSMRLQLAQQEDSWIHLKTQEQRCHCKAKYKIQTEQQVSSHLP